MITYNVCCLHYKHIIQIKTVKQACKVFINKLVRRLNYYNVRRQLLLKIHNITMLGKESLVNRSSPVQH